MVWENTHEILIFISSGIEWGKESRKVVFDFYLITITSFFKLKRELNFKEPMGGEDMEKELIILLRNFE